MTDQTGFFVPSLGAKCNRDTFSVCWGLNPGPLACQSSTLPHTHAMKAYINACIHFKIVFLFFVFFLQITKLKLLP